jgi:hypothetical protein
LPRVESDRTDPITRAATDLSTGCAAKSTEWININTVRVPVRGLNSPILLRLFRLLSLIRPTLQSSPTLSARSPSPSSYPSHLFDSHRHSHLPAHTSTPHCNEANTLLPPHYITPSPLLTPRRTSSHLPSPLITPSPVLPTLATMSPQVLVPPPIPQTPSLQDQLRSASRSERLLRETLRRDRAASLSPRTRVRRPESSSGRIASTSSEMFHSACTDSDEEGDEHHDNALHVSLLFANPATSAEDSHRHSNVLRRVPRTYAPYLVEAHLRKGVHPLGHSHRLFTSPFCSTKPTGKFHVWCPHDPNSRPLPRP